MVDMLSMPPVSTTSAWPTWISMVAMLAAFMPGRARLVDGHTGHVRAAAALEGGGATRVHVVACLTARRDDRVVDVVTRDLGTSQGLADGERCDVVHLHILQRAAEPAHGRADGAHEHNVTQLAHCTSSFGTSHTPLGRLDGLRGGGIGNP